jgi:hypothetical protein
VAEQWKEGRVPLWNPYIFGGTPLLAAIQGGVFYAPNVLLLLEPLWLWYGYSILLQYSLSGVFSFLYLRRLDLSRAAAVAGSLVYALGAFSMGHLGHVGMLRTVPWLPLALWGFEAGAAGVLHQRRRAAIGLMAVAGHPRSRSTRSRRGTHALWLTVGEAGERRRAFGAPLMSLRGIAASVAAHR